MDYAAELADVTDLHIKVGMSASGQYEADIDSSLVFPGAFAPSGGVAACVVELQDACREIARRDFMVKLGSVFFRGHRDDRAVDGVWYRLRKMAQEPPSLEALPSPMPAHIKSALLAPELARGGLVYICGGPGSGKTTTASAIVISRLKSFGGMAYTVEDPPELPLNGRHGQGYCTQTMVAGDDAADWTESMRGVLRSQPVGTPLILYVGEVRDSDTARMMLRASNNGFLVICTAFGTDIISSVDAFYQLLGGDHAGAFASSLRLIVYQRILDGRFMPEMLMSEGPASRVATLIRNKTITQLKDEILYQRNLMSTVFRGGAR